MAANLENRRDPLISGIRIGSKKGPLSSTLPIGTLGCFIFVENRGTDRPAGVYLLTNQHVIEGEKKTKLVDTARLAMFPQFSTVAFSISQPPDSIAFGDSDNQIGIGFEGQLDSKHDCAIVKLNRKRNFSNVVEAIKVEKDVKKKVEINFSEVDDPKEGDIVFKVGGKTGYTRGKITFNDVGGVKKLLEEKNNQNYFIIEPIDNKNNTSKNIIFADSGDSGSIIIRESDNKVVGLLFSREFIVKEMTGTPKGSRGIAYPIKTQLEVFGSNTRLARLGDIIPITF